MAANIRFNYLYRDSGNWKYFGWFDFMNPMDWSLEETERQIRQYLIDGEYFYPEKVGIPTLRFHDQLPESNSWYEFESVQWSDRHGSSKERIDAFVIKLAGNNKPMTRDDFMDFFRDVDKLNQLSPDDRIEVFSTILLGSSDFTAELLNSILSDYGIGDLIVIDIAKHQK